MEESKKVSRRKIGMIAGSFTFFMIFVVSAVLILSNVQLFSVIEDEETGEMKLHLIGKFSSASAEANPGSGKSGWLATFLLDYAETPGTCLASNASGGGYDGWGNVTAYEDADNQETDTPSEDPFYFVVRARFNDTVKDGSDFIDARCYVYLTVSGDETISNVAGTRVVSYNNTGGAYIYINFYWDDAVDGYRVTDDGSCVWNCSIYAQY